MFNFGFHFWCLALYFDFHKVNVIWKKEIDLKYLIQGIMGIFMVYAI